MHLTYQDPNKTSDGDRPAFPIEINVRGGEEGFPVQICVDEESNRLVIRGFNEGGFAAVDIDFLDLARLFRELEGSPLAAAIAEHHLGHAQGNRG